MIDDASEYGEPASPTSCRGGPSATSWSSTDTIQVGQTDFAATVTKVESSEADAVFFGGYYAEAALIVRQLTRRAASRARSSVADGVEGPGFVEAAGKAAEGTVITCPCIPAEDPAVADSPLTTRRRYGGAPGTYAAEAYDAANIFLDGIAEGIDNREDMLAFVNDYDEAGVTKQLSFDETGEPADVHVYAYKVEGGKIVSDQRDRVTLTRCSGS